MIYKEQMEKWIQQHPNATIEEAWMAGYWQCSDNWCKKEYK